MKTIFFKGLLYASVETHTVLFFFSRTAKSRAAFLTTAPIVCKTRVGVLTFGEGWTLTLQHLHSCAQTGTQSHIPLQGVFLPVLHQPMGRKQNGKGKG